MGFRSPSEYIILVCRNGIAIVIGSSLNFVGIVIGDEEPQIFWIYWRKIALYYDEFFIHSQPCVSFWHSHYMKDAVQTKQIDHHIKDIKD